MTFKLLLFIKKLALITAGLILFTSCNKDVEDAVPLTPEPNSGQTLGQLLSDQNYSVFKAALTRVGLIASLDSGVYTVFAPDDAGLAAAGINAAVVNALPLQTLAAIVQYHIVGGQRITPTMIAGTSPNLQLPTELVLAPPSAAIPVGLRMPTFPSAQGNVFWVNNIPIVGAPVQASNGILYNVVTVVVPPSTTVKGVLSANLSKFSILLAAFARADSGQVAGPTTRLDSLINYPPANLTLFAPNNDAFRALFPPGTPDAAIIGALNTPALFPAQNVRGLIAYHLAATRYFTVNIPVGNTPLNTLLQIPGNNPPVIPVIAIKSPPALGIKDVRTGSIPATVITGDIQAANGIVHEIDRVLMPQ